MLNFKQKNLNYYVCSRKNKDFEVQMSNLFRFFEFYTLFFAKVFFVKISINNLVRALPCSFPVLLEISTFSNFFVDPISTEKNNQLGN